MVDIAFEITYDASGLDPTHRIKATTVFTSVPPVLREDLRGALSTWWTYDERSNLLRRDNDSLFRFGPSYARWTSRELSWRAGSTHLGNMVDRVTLVSADEMKLVGEYARDGKTWVLDHEASCTRTSIASQK